MILNLNYNVLKTIMLLVVASASGVTDLAKALAVCKTFAIFGDDKDLLKMANFKDFALPNSIENCEHIRGLLVRCAEAGNTYAQYMLAQVILLRFSQLEDRNMLPPFLCYFMPEQTINSDSGKGKLIHVELVGLFLRGCSILDHASMVPHVQNYVDHFRNGIKDCTEFYRYYSCMTNILQIIVDVGKYRNRFYYPVEYVLDRLARYHECYVPMAIHLSQWKWEELKKECRFMDEELLSYNYHVEPLEENVEILDMGNRIFYYLALNGPRTREIDLALDRYGDKLWAKCMRYAKTYKNCQQKAALSFNEMFVADMEDEDAKQFRKRKREMKPVRI